VLRLLGNKFLPKKRTPIPKATQNKLLVESGHCCNMCGRPWVEIHHIDMNPSNNRECNLIPLCPNCASMVHMKIPPHAGVQAITPEQLRLYKKDWIEKRKSKNPQVVERIQELEAKYVELKGEVRRLKQSKEGE
jgi:hypothetical protein